MPSRTSASIAKAKEDSLNPRKTVSGPRSKRIALNSRNRSLGGEKKPIAAQPQRAFPPKSEYEKFYESVFLAEESQAEEEETTDCPKPGPRSKRPLHALLNDDQSQTETARPAKIPALKKTTESVDRVNGISPKPKGKARQFEDYYTKTERHVWKKDAEQMLLQLWAQNLKEFRGESKNVPIYRKMAEQMSQFGPSHTELKTKIDNMSRKYRIEAEKVRETGVPSKWEYFHKLQALLIGTKSVDVFEDIMHDNPAETINYGQDAESEDEEMNLMKAESMVDDQKDESESELCAKESIRRVRAPPSPIIPDFQDEEDEEQMEETAPLPVPKYHTKRKMPISHSNRLLQIEEEKLMIEREKLQVMKEALLELNSFHKDIVNLFKYKNQ
ncbi:uncharacterized protein LOC128260181 [Drosophila gunungcola]|uniref:Myb/SANT-like DNA-binding domain-containing protein n=1 Tax=Drosophila gunungcola TaxID=103775 RepID=A0A9P9YGR8_9MUSC|nr:uncharacterized protein LOC128260181 [Drosophila gunungcola]KAI8036669.1 hypothetical protein M5D96_010470 [Drosophila gunungcola]